MLPTALQGRLPWWRQHAVAAGADTGVAAACLLCRRDGDVRDRTDIHLHCALFDLHAVLRNSGVIGSQFYHIEQPISTTARDRGQAAHAAHKAERPDGVPNSTCACPVLSAEPLLWRNRQSHQSAGKKLMLDLLQAWRTKTGRLWPWRARGAL